MNGLTTLKINCVCEIYFCNLVFDDIQAFNIKVYLFILLQVQFGYI